MILHDQTIGIRQFCRDDAPGLHAAVRESILPLCTFMTWCVLDYSLQDCLTFIDKSADDWGSGKQYNFAIIDVQTGTLLGSVGLNRIDRLHRCANLGYWVRQSWTQRGVATAAIRLISRFGLIELGFQRLEIRVSGNNLASERVAQKAGAQFEGVLRRRLILADGIYDAFLYSLVSADLTQPLPAPLAGVENKIS
ncbi:MAG TPA: GNAT family N-acetyltransferase [Verrucomicrobiae bacterium]|nr:GNAT family N-acetyltransferase [Verrucomicrobiae bacterium]